MNAYVVMAMCSMDDVLLGVYEHDVEGKAKAMRKARAVALDPDSRFQATWQSNDTTFLFARVYQVTKGTQIRMVAEFEFEEEEAVAAKE